MTRHQQLHAPGSRGAGRVAAAALLAAAIALPGFAQDAPYYAGKRITIVVTWGPGGTGDVYARVLARHLPEHIPGAPAIVVENMTGGGHNIGANFLYNRAEPDGLTFGLFPSHRVVGDLLDEDGIDYQADRFTWLASLSTLASTCAAWHEAGIASVDDLDSGGGDEWIVGSKSAGDVANIVGNMVIDDLKWPLRIILGYAEDSDIKLAIESGELEGTCAPWTTLTRDRPEWEAEGLLKPLFVVAPNRDPALPDVPAVVELPWSPAYLDAITAYVSRFAIAVPVVAPPGLPDELRDTLRDGIRATLADPDYLDEIARVGQVTVTPLVGDEVDAVVARMFALPAAAWDIVGQSQR